MRRGVFHYPIEELDLRGTVCILSPVLQLFEGLIEAYRMAASLDAPAWRRYRPRTPTLAILIRDARTAQEWHLRRRPLRSARPATASIGEGATSDATIGEARDERRRHRR